MPVSKLNDLPDGGGGRWPLSGQGGFRSAQWGDKEVGYTVVGPANHAAVYKGLPGDVCQCPHYGYVFTGRIRTTYPGSDWPDEVASTGKAYFFRRPRLELRGGHRGIELNPAYALQVLMDQVESNIRAMVAGAADGQSPALEGRFTMSTHRCPADDDAAIRNVLGLAALLNDEGEPEDQRKVYASEATWHLGEITRVGADEMVAAAVERRRQGLLGPGTGTRHLMTLLTIDVTGDAARAVAYFAFVKGTAITASGTYHDELTHTEAGWRIARREIIFA